MKKKDFKKLTTEQADLVRCMTLLTMGQRQNTIPHYTNSESSSQLSELLKDASDKAESEKSDIQMVYNEIVFLKAALRNEKRKRKQLEKRLQSMDAKWNKNFEKTGKKLYYMEEIIFHITTYTGKIKGNTLPSILKSLKKNLYERKGCIMK